MSTAGGMDCPVCGILFSADTISDHVNACLEGDFSSTSTSKPKETRKRRKQADWDFLTGNGVNSSKTGKKRSTSSASPSAQSAKKGKATSGANRLGDRLKRRSKSSSNDEDFKFEEETSDVEFVSEETGCCNTNNSNASAQKDINQQANGKKFPDFQTSRPSSSKSNSTSDRETMTISEASVTKNNYKGPTFLDRMRNSNTATTPARKNKMQSNAPLAERVRPNDLADFIGQKTAVGKKTLLHSLLAHGDKVPSMILWGPPGCGKTTLAKIIAHKCKELGTAKFVIMSATSASVNDVKEAVKIAKNDFKMLRKKTILFLDEIHRFNKLQQDVLLPHVEDGTLTLIGATTETPSFQVNSALLSRCRVITLGKLEIEDVKAILMRALTQLEVSVLDEENDMTDNGSTDVRCRCVIEADAVEVLAGLVDGDARAALNGLQMAVESRLAETEEDATDEQEEEEEEVKKSNNVVCITVEDVKEGLQKSHILYDKTAFIKSMRGSDANAALYWLSRMLEGGENPMFVARRLVVFASEDVGLADAQALVQAVSTMQACHFIGMPECAVNLAQCVVYMSRAPKSVEVYTALAAARQCVRGQVGALPSVPLHLRNASNKFLKSQGYGKGYKYPPAFPGKSVEQDYLPSSLLGTDFFVPGNPFSKT
ncbi:ATPase WRNIP1 isoform X2 [Aplysia californica]|uniref:ATPase WRNIP1 isoform X2 n=1 Tax=Aplysia californica TaxID=6500 RepID=A0ABM0JVP2_APLCA|nr:ATPase WRNIP1 isoform X2 [Aplysia californica]